MAGLTYSAWANPTNDAGTDSTRVILAIGGGNWPPYWSYYYGYYRASQMRGYASGSASFGNYGKLGTGFPRDVWSHGAMSLGYDAAANESTMRMYVNGGEILSQTVAGNAIRSPLSGRPLIIGGYTHSTWPNSAPAHPYQGWIDEARVSNICRSPAWLAASYHNQKPGSTMLAFGGVEPPRGSLVILR